MQRCKTIFSTSTNNIAKSEQNTYILPSIFYKSPLEESDFPFSFLKIEVKYCDCNDVQIDSNIITIITDINYITNCKKKDNNLYILQQVLNNTYCDNKKLVNKHIFMNNLPELLTNKPLIIGDFSLKFLAHIVTYSTLFGIQENKFILEIIKNINNGYFCEILDMPDIKLLEKVLYSEYYDFHIYK